MIYSLALGTGLRLAEIVFLPDALLAKFRRFWRHKATRREGLQPEDPLFCSQSRTRISPRRVQFAFRPGR